MKTFSACFAISFLRFGFWFELAPHGLGSAVKKNGNLIKGVKTSSKASGKIFMPPELITQPRLPKSLKLVNRTTPIDCFFKSLCYSGTLLSRVAFPLSSGVEILLKTFQDNKVLYHWLVAIDFLWTQLAYPAAVLS
jgi:hypothetical protein